MPPTDENDVRIVAASPADLQGILSLFPRLASFELPNGRNPEHLWGGDADMLRAWAAGRREDCLVNVAADSERSILGATMLTLRSELLSHSPSAHLEVLVVAAGAEGRGVGGALLQRAEAEARENGALSISLNVFANNVRARRVYERAGYDGELMRYIKPFTKDALT